LFIIPRPLKIEKSRDYPKSCSARLEAGIHPAGPNVNAWRALGLLKLST